MRLPVQPDKTIYKPTKIHTTISPTQTPKAAGWYLCAAWGFYPLCRVFSKQAFLPCPLNQNIENIKRIPPFYKPMRFLVLLAKGGYFYAFLQGKPL